MATICNQRLYMLCQIKRQGLPLNCLRLVFHSFVMSRLMYASTSCSGYLNVECVSTIQKLFTKSVKWGVTSKRYQAADIFDSYQLVCYNFSSTRRCFVIRMLYDSF